MLAQIVREFVRKDESQLILFAAVHVELETQTKPLETERKTRAVV